MRRLRGPPPDRLVPAHAPPARSAHARARRLRGVPASQASAGDQGHEDRGDDRVRRPGGGAAGDDVRRRRLRQEARAASPPSVVRSCRSSTPMPPPELSWSRRAPAGRPNARGRRACRRWTGRRAEGPAGDGPRARRVPVDVARRARRTPARARGRARVRRDLPRASAVRPAAARPGLGLHSDLRIGARDQRSDHGGPALRSVRYPEIAGPAVHWPARICSRRS